MFCKKCGKESKGEQKFCTNCGKEFLGTIKNNFDEAPTFSFDFKKILEIRRIIPAIIIILFIGWGMYSSFDDSAIEINNNAISDWDSGKSDQAISQFKQASDEAFTDETKVTTLVNLGYIYSSELQYDEALQSFEEALLYTKKDSFDYFLISGEIALLEFKPNSALISYNKAYELNPNDFQINNALGLFYLDLEDIASNYLNYPKAVQYLQKAYEVSDYATKNTAKANLGIAYFFNDNFDQTISLLSSLDLNSKPYMAYWLGLTYAAKDDVTNAKFYLQKAVNAGVEVEQEVYDYLYTY